jgi:predicted nucleic acid-binding protein
MTFADLPTGANVFIDANTFVYAFSNHPQFGQPSRTLLERVDRGELSGTTSAHTLVESAHRLMTLEACAKFNWPFHGIASRLRRHPAELQQLSAFRQAIDQALKSKIHVFAVQPKHVLDAADVSRQCGLLSNDALVVAVMQANGLTAIASHDADFDRVPTLSRYAPI